jgi:hypothetical protein
MIDRSYLVVLVPGLPVLALGRSLFWDLQTAVFKILWVLEDVPYETSAQVPCDVAVEWLTEGSVKYLEVYAIVGNSPKDQGCPGSIAGQCRNPTEAEQRRASPGWRGW